MIVLVAVYVTLITASAAREGNLSCFQCTKNSPEPCPEETLLPCQPGKDRCVSHYSKDSVNGYVMKKECGLGPCGFQDDMVNRGLGLADQCDTSKNEYFCVFCCKESGCNSVAMLTICSSLLFVPVLSLIIFF